MTCIFCEDAIYEAPLFIAGDPIHTNCYARLGAELNNAFNTDHDNCCGDQIVLPVLEDIYVR